MTATRIATATAAGAVIAWAAKAIAIALAGGLDKSPLESPLFFVGLLLLLVALAAAGVAIVGHRRAAWTRALGAVGGVLVGFPLFLLVETGVSALLPESAGWVENEAGLWVASILTALVVIALASRTARTQSPGRP